MALTATANHQVRDDIVRSLKITGCVTITASFNRENLIYEIRPKHGKKVVEEIGTFINDHHRGECGIIYATSRDGCEKLAKELREKHRVSVAHYHAGMSKDDKLWTQDAWQKGEISVIVATVRLGSSFHSDVG
jgi:bloom syndrome protein